MLIYNIKIIIVILLILFTILAAVYNELYTKINYSYFTINVNDMYDILETGDIIYFSFTNFLKPYFSHVGMAIVYDNDTYILDLSETFNVDFHPLKMKMMTYLEIFGTNIYISKLRNDKNPSLETIMKFIDRIPDYKNMYQYNKQVVNKVVFDCTRKKLLNMNVNDTRYGTNKLICSEFLTMCLRDLGVIPSDIDIYCKTPEDFLMLKDKHNKLYVNNYNVVLDKN